MVSQKDLKILSYLAMLAEKQKSATIEELAEHFEISNRTVRNNLERIDYYLKTSGLHQLKRDRKNGITLDMEQQFQVQNSFLFGKYIGFRIHIH